MKIIDRTSRSLFKFLILLIIIALVLIIAGAILILIDWVIGLSFPLIEPLKTLRDFDSLDLSYFALIINFACEMMILFYLTATGLGEPIVNLVSKAVEIIFDLAKEKRPIPAVKNESFKNLIVLCAFSVACISTILFICNYTGIS